MRRDKESAIVRLCVFLSLATASPTPPAWAKEAPRIDAKQGIAIGGSVSDSTINNTINGMDSAAVSAMVKVYTDRMGASDDAKARAEQRAKELADKLNFTTAAVVEAFRILGEQNVPEEQVPARLIVIISHFAQTRDALAALAPDDPQAAELSRQAKQAFDAGRLVEADARLEQAKDLEAAALREASRLLQRAQEAVDRHATNLAKLEATQGDIALTQLHYADAARHYELAASRLPPGAPDTKAHYLESAGNALQTSGSSTAARADFSQAQELFAGLTQTDRGNALWRSELSAVEQRVGDVQMTQGDLTGAMNSYRDALAIADRLAKSDPGNAVWRRNLSAMDESVGNVLLAQGDLAGALKSYNDDLAIADQLAKSDPSNAGWQSDLAVSHEHVGVVQEAQGDLADALKSYSEDLAINDRLAKVDPGDAPLQRNLSTSHGRVGNVQVAQGDLAGAMKSYGADLAITVRLAHSNPGNAEWQRDLFVADQKVGRRASGAGRPRRRNEILPRQPRNH